MMLFCLHISDLDVDKEAYVVSSFRTILGNRVLSAVTYVRRLSICDTLCYLIMLDVRKLICPNRG